MATIEMTPENRPLLEALMRVVAMRDPDAEEMLVQAILELVALRAKNAALRERNQALAVENLALREITEYVAAIRETHETVRWDAGQAYIMLTRARALLASEEK